MASWATRNKLKYLSILLGFLLVVIGVPLFFILTSPPSCSDGKRNGGESGTDCGGSCIKLCPAETPEPIVLWQRFFKVAPGVYSVAAYVENINSSAEVKSVGYSFKLYDSNNILVTERRGRTFIPPHKIFTIFEGGIGTEERLPTRAIFQFTESFDWERSEYIDPPIEIKNKVIRNETTAPRVEVTVYNPTVRTLSLLEVVAIVYDTSDNAIGVSRTIIDELESNDEHTIAFTWPAPFAGAVARVEILHRLPL
ncbi:MAG: hypothetical protein Q7S15_01770 [bacterium]|nr:hypothetical protein [bacterium]